MNDTDTTEDEAYTSSDYVQAIVARALRFGAESTEERAAELRAEIAEAMVGGDPATMINLLAMLTVGVVGAYTETTNKLAKKTGKKRRTTVPQEMRSIFEEMAHAERVMLATGASMTPG